MAMLSKLREVFGTFGVADGLVYLANRGLQGLSGGRVRLLKYYIVAQPVPAPAATPPRRSASMEVRVLDRDEILATEWPRPRHVIERRVAEGAECVAVFAKGRMVGFQWTLAGPYEEDEIRTLFCPLPEGRAAWDFDIFVEPEYRVGRAFLRLWDETNARLHARGVRWCVSRISAVAIDSRRSHARMQAVDVGACLYLCVGSVQLSLFDRRPFVHLGFGPGSRPVFRAVAPADRMPAGADRAEFENR
jgi:hypothetical protein